MLIRGKWVEKIITKKGYYLTFSLYFVAFGVMISIITSVINYQLSFTNMEKTFLESATNEVDFSRFYLQRFVDETEMIVEAVQKSNIVQAYIESRQITDKQRVQDLFLALALSNQNIMQLRYINVQGKEDVRIDRDFINMHLNVITDENLQDKKGRYYFIETARLNGGQFWHSKIDLNIEHGEIEDPLKPTFRIATPLYIHNNFEGIVIVNMKLKNVIENLTHSTTFDVHLMDKNGEIISTPNKVGWSRFFEQSENGLAMFPSHMKQIIANNNYVEEGLFSFSIAAPFKTTEGLKIIYTPKVHVMAKLKESNIILALILALLVLFISIPLAWLASIIPSRLQSNLSKAYNEIQHNANIIDNYVIITHTDKNANITSVSDNFTKVTGYSSLDSVGQKQSILRHPDTPIKVYEDLWRTILEGKVWQGELKNLNKHGDLLWLRTIIKPQLADNGEVVGFTSISQDITDRKLLEEIARTDHLTGLYNRIEFDRILAREISRFNRYQLPFSIIIIDIDFFKKINDIHGHIIGDKTLIALADIIKASTRLSDLASRWGGEEFVIITTGTNSNDSLIVAENLRNKIEQYKFPIVGKVTVSCGITEYQNGEQPVAVVERADRALYKAKNSGRNCSMVE